MVKKAVCRKTPSEHGTLREMVCFSIFISATFLNVLAHKSKAFGDLKRSKTMEP